MSAYPDIRELIDCCINDQRDAQYELYSRYSKAMYNICCRMMNNQAEAEDVLQMSFMDVFSNLTKFRHESSLGSWIKRIVVNNCINEIKRKKVFFDEIKDSDAYDVPEEVNETVDELTVERVNRAIQQLPEGYKTVFSLYIMEGYDHKEIGQILEISEATSKSQYSRAKKKIRHFLSKDVKWISKNI